mmetsp:Transcript_29965/g.61663  ORF Transcript_29965/g.61663 Transcript_29965/m.61663 type:complete len:136 (+) Transcript_29965:565-972(+)
MTQGETKVWRDNDALLFAGTERHGAVDGPLAHQTRREGSAAKHASVAHDDHVPARNGAKTDDRDVSEAPATLAFRVVLATGHGRHHARRVYTPTFVPTGHRLLAKGSLGGTRQEQDIFELDPTGDSLGQEAKRGC